MKYRISVTNRFKKDIKRCQQRHLPMEKFKEVTRLLEENGKLPPIYKPHKLSLLFTNTGSHSDIF